MKVVVFCKSSKTGLNSDQKHFCADLLNHRTRIPFSVKVSSAFVIIVSDAEVFSVMRKCAARLNLKQISIFKLFREFGILCVCFERHGQFHVFFMLLW